jgi:hypothetical protein
MTMDPTTLRADLRAAESDEQRARNDVDAYKPTLRDVQREYDRRVAVREDAHRKTEHLRRRLAAMRLEDVATA